MSQQEAKNLSDLAPVDLDIQISPELPEEIRSKASVSFDDQGKPRKLLSVKYSREDISISGEIFLPDQDLKCYGRYCIISPLRIGSVLKRGTSSIILPGQTQKDNDYLSTIGMFICGGDTFYEVSGFHDAKLRPQPGDLVMFRKYGGMIFPFKGEDFRMEKDVEIFMPIKDPLDYAQLI